STLILGQSKEIIDHVKSIVPEKSCFLYRNFPDHKTSEFTLSSTSDEPIKIFYAGLLGVAQGVFELCKQLKLNNLNIELHIFGDGAEKKQIEDFIKNNSEKKIIFHGMMERNQLLNKLTTFDIALVPLKARIYGSVPSKIFEYGSLGFPVLYFGGGEGEDIVKENNMGWIAPVGDYEALNKELELISELPKENFSEMKTDLFQNSKTSFNLDKQIADLLSKKVF
ncbi:glycosyltransferase, partial [uncultured Flavobacterium sp.]